MTGNKNFSGVRLAQIPDARRWGQIQAKAMRNLLVTSLPQVSPTILEQIEEETMVQTWCQTIANPPSAKHHLFSAVDTHDIHGFAALAPAPQITVIQGAENTGQPTENPLLNQGSDAEIVAFEVADWEDLSHASRLLNALADVLAKTGGKRMQLWIAKEDKRRQDFFREAGFGPAGIRQKFQIGPYDLEMQLWYTDLNPFDETP